MAGCWPAVDGVVPALGDDFQTQWLGGLAQFGEQELAVLIVQHADAPGLRQHGPYQTQLPSRRRIAPEQAELMGK